MISSEIQQQLNQVQALANQRQIPRALALAKKITTSHPECDQAWFISAFLYFQNNQAEQSIEATKQAKSLDPKNQTYAFQEIMLFEALNRPDLVLTLSQKLATKPIQHIEIAKKTAEILENNEAFDLALDLYQKLSQLEPNNQTWMLKQAEVNQYLGHIGKAKILTNSVLQKSPNDPNGLFLRSQLSKQSTQNNHLEALIKASETNSNPPNEQAKIYFALAKELEDCEQYKKSFEARKMGADLFRSSFQYDVQSDIEFMRSVQSEYDQAFVKRNTANNTSDRPIFIVGLPRTGTTLLDRIITNHSDVFAAGELRQLNRCVLQGLQNLNIDPNIPRSEMVKHSRNIDFDQLGQNYLTTSSLRGGDGPRFTDKFPQNSYYVGMILKALPNAKIIIMQRHPVSICYAVYKQLFSNDSYPFSYDLKEMALYYNQHNKLLNHWQDIGGDSVRTVHYEDLVNDLENQAQDILKFLDLPWQTQCLDFQKNKQPTATASASQVREKLYTSSVDLWRNYEKQLQPLIKLIASPSN